MHIKTYIKNKYSNKILDIFYIPVRFNLFYYLYFSSILYISSEINPPPPCALQSRRRRAGSGGSDTDGECFVYGKRVVSLPAVCEIF